MEKRRKSMIWASQVALAMVETGLRLRIYGNQGRPVLGNRKTRTRNACTHPMATTLFLTVAAHRRTGGGGHVLAFHQDTPKVIWKALPPNISV